MSHTAPDGVEVVATGEDAARLSSPPLLILEPVRAFLDQHGIGDGPIAWERIGDGQSNVTFRIRRGQHDVVLRRGPRPPLPRSTHDMVREARIQQLLRPFGVPVPEVLAVCEDDSVLGVPFYVMEALDGVVLTDTTPPHLDAAESRRDTSRALVEALVTLHGVDVTAGGLASFGRPEGYLRRQVKRFSALWEVNTTRELSLVSRLADWLTANLPTSHRATVVHGDYRLGNLMFAPQSPVRVRAILDWEMATIGDPLADLGYLTATYSDADSPATPLDLSPVTRLPGYLPSAEIAKLYAARTGADLGTLSWYQALALWKAAIFSEAIYTRWLAGQRPHDTTFAATLESGVPVLLAAAAAHAGVSAR